MKIGPDETVLIGKWLLEDGRVIGDATCQRIHWLTNNHLQKIKASEISGGWEVLYRDPDDGRFWEHTFPQSGLHGGGPPALIAISRESARKKYGPLE